MNPPDLLTLFDRDQRIGIQYLDMRKDVLSHLTRFVRAAPGMSFILHSHLDEHNADAAIAEQVAYFAALNQRFNWKVYEHDTPADLAERLVAQGFVADDPDAVMVLDLHNSPDVSSSSQNYFPTPALQHEWPNGWPHVPSGDGYQP